MKTEKKLQFILNHHGNENQIEQAIEECSELILALQKLKRHGLYDNVRLLQVNEEIADVDIMIGQLKMIFEIEIIENFKCEKLDREILRINSKS